MKNEAFETKDTGLFSGEVLHAVPLEFKADDETGVFEGYASIFNTEDLGGDTVLPGAFAAHLATTNLKQVKMLYQHRPDKVIGHYTDVREDTRGLYVKGQLALDVECAREVHALMKVGALDSMSIGYKTIRSERDEDKWTRKLIEVELWEVSIVTFPMLPGATVNSVKSVPTTEREFETQLRDAFGFSKKEATAVALHGFKALDGLRDAGPDGDSGSDFLKELQSARSAMQA